MWGAVTSGNTYTTTTSSFPTGWTQSTSDASSATQLVLYSGHYIQTDNFCQNGFTSIVVKARKYNGPDATERVITVEWIPSGGGAAVVMGTLDPTTTTLTDKTLSSFTNTPTANTTGSIKISCKNAAAAKGDAISEVTITYTAGTCNTKYTVTLKDNDATITQASAGASITLPSRTGCEGYTFAGWTKTWTEEQDEWTTTAPTIIAAGSYTPSANENLYPVYTKTESSTVTKSYGWETTSHDDWTIGTQPSRANSNAHTGSYAGYINTANTYVTFVNKVKVTEFSFWFKRTSGNDNYNVYIETSTNGSTWTAAETYAMSGFSNGSYNKKTKTWDGSTEYYVRFHCYNTTAVRYVDDISITYSASVTSYISVPDCCTPLGSINGSFL